MSTFMEQHFRHLREGRKEYTEAEVRLIIEAAVNEEREACAKECDELAGMLFGHGDKSGAEIAVSLRDTIRARGQA